MANQHQRGSELSADNIKSTLTSLFPHLRTFWQRPLGDYARAVYDVDPIRLQAIDRNDALLRLCTLLTRVAIRTGVTDDDANDAGSQFMGAPIIQTGPHCHLIMEPDAFYTHLFSLLGIRSQRLRWHFWYGASTVKFIEKPGKGPGWLTLEGELINVFGLPRSRMDSFNVCGERGPYRFTLRPHGDDKRVNLMAERLKLILPELQYRSAADAIKAGNDSLWKTFFPPDIRLVQLDDIDVAELVADHFEDPDSWLCRRFIEGGIACEMLQIAAELNQGPWAGWIRCTTDLFWRLEKGRLYPIRLNDGVLVTEGKSSAELRFTPAALSESLRLRQIVPSLLLSFIVMSILPGTRVLGGCRQTVYYPLMRYVFACALERAGERELLASLRKDVLPGMWGHRVLRPADGRPFAALNEVGSAAALLSEFGERSLERACGDLTCFTSDPIWGQIGRHVALGDTLLDSVEWQWA